MSEELHYSGKRSGYNVPANDEVLYENTILSSHGIGPGRTVELDRSDDPDPEATIIKDILKRCGRTGIWGTSVTQREPDPPLYPNPTASDFLKMPEEDRQYVAEREKAMAEEKTRRAKAAPADTSSTKPARHQEPAGSRDLIGDYKAKHTAKQRLKTSPQKPEADIPSGSAVWPARTFKVDSKGVATEHYLSGKKVRAGLLKRLIHKIRRNP